MSKWQKSMPACTVDIEKPHHFSNTIEKYLLDLNWNYDLILLVSHIQGDPNQNLKFVLAITLKIWVSDPMLVKPKCVWEVSVYFQFSAVCLQFSTVCLQFSKLNWHHPNTFWLYQYRVRYASFQSYSQNKFQILIWVTLYYSYVPSIHVAN